MTLLKTHEAFRVVLQLLTSSKEHILLVNDSGKNIVKFSCNINLKIS